MKIVEDIEKAWAEKQYGQLVSYAKRLRDADLKGLPPHILSFLGVGCAIAGELKVSVRPLWVGYKKNPSDLNARLNLGNCLKDLGDFRGARDVYMEDPSSMGDALITLGAGICDLEIGRYSDALKLLERSLTLSRTKEALLNLGRALLALEDIVKARDCFIEALSVDPSYLPAAINLSVCYIKNSEYENAHSLGMQILKGGHRDDRYLEEMIKASLEVSAPRVGLSFFDEFGEQSRASTKFLAAEAHRFLRNLDRSSELCRQVIKQVPDHFSAHVVLAHSLAEQGLTVEAEEVSSAGFAIKDLEHVAIEHLPNPWTLFALRDEPALQHSLSLRYSRATYDRLGRASIPRSSKKSKTVIAYMSPDFGQHPVAEIMLPTFRQHDRNRFEVHALSFRARPDEMTDKIAEAVDGFHDCISMQYPQVRALTDELGVDILVDLAVYTSSGRPNYLGLGLAPIQVNHLGYSGTSGGKAYDLIIGDSFTIPSGYEKYYSERVVKLDVPVISGGLRPHRDIAPFDRSKFGIPDSAVIYGCLANPYKFNIQMLRSWAEILKQVPGAVLMFGRVDEGTFHNLRNQFSKFDIAPSRIFNSGDQPSKEEHFARIKVVDIFLDTYPYNAHSLAADAVSAEIPVVSMAGESFASRVAGSLNAALDLDELNCNSVEEYVREAVSLGTDPQRLEAIRRRLTQALDGTNWGERYAADFEEKLSEMVISL